MDTINVTKRAFALVYDQQKDSAPKIIANARRHLALKLLAYAEESGVEIHHDPDHVETLSKLPVEKRSP